MKIRLGVATQLLTSTCCVWLVSSAGAQPQDRTRPVAVVPPVVLAPLANVAAVGVSASAAKMPVLVEKLRAHSLSPQQAWDAGDLEVPDLIYFLESLDRWGGFYWDKDSDLRRQIVALLVEHGQKSLEQPETLSPAVRLWLADYYGSIGDPRCLAFCESILREQKDQDVFLRAGGWKTQPIQSDVKEVIIKTNPSQPDKPLYARFRIKTYDDTSVTATVDNPTVQVRVLPIENRQNGGLNSQEQEAVILIRFSTQQPIVDMPVVISSAIHDQTTTVRASVVAASAKPAAG